MLDVALTSSTHATYTTLATPRALNFLARHNQSRQPYLHVGFGCSRCLYRLKCHKSRKHIHSKARATCTGAVAAATSLEGVDVVVERAERNSRRLYASVQIAAPVETVWRALTDYEGLSNFIPGLAENRCLSKKPAGATLLQIGEQDVAFGAKFRARVVLDIQEHAEGTPQSLCSGQSGSRIDEQLYPLPRGPSSGCPSKDVCFSMIEGDFQAFKGIWRMQPGNQGPNSCRLSYSLFVRPQVWLPVRLIQSRIEGEVKNNLAAVRRHSEGLSNGRKRPSGAQQQY